MANRNRVMHPAFDLYRVPTLYGPKGATEAWAEGAQLVEDTSQLDESGSDPAATTIVGIAAEPTTTADAAGVQVPYYPNFQGMVFEGTLNIAAGGYVLAAADFLTSYGTLIDADGIHFINQADTTAPSVHIVGFKDPIGTIAPRVFFIYLDNPF